MGFVNQLRLCDRMFEMSCPIPIIIIITSTCSHVHGLLLDF